MQCTVYNHGIGTQKLRSNNSGDALNYDLDAMRAG